MGRPFIILFLLLSGALLGQERDLLLKEQLGLISNKQVLLTGEEVRYHILPLQSDSATLSKIAYVELINPDKKSVIRQKVQLNKGKGDGYMYLPSTLPTGGYQLIVYTRWMKNFPRKDIFQYPLQVINPFRPFENVNETESTNITLTSKHGGIYPGVENQFHFNISAPDSILFKELRILNTDGESIVSVPIRRKKTGDFTWTPQEQGLTGSYSLM